MQLDEHVVELRAGDALFRGLSVVPAGDRRPRPCVLVAHTIRGRTDFERDKARALAHLGYAALAIDVFGEDAEGASAGRLRSLMQGLLEDRDTLRARLTAWLDLARQQEGVDGERMAAIGFCFGGLCALDLARSGAELAGVVSFHGLLDAPPAGSSRPIRAKLLALHGWEDPLARPEQVVALAGELTAAGADWQIHAYGNTLHAFTNPAAADRDAGLMYNADADRRSWTAMRNFLAELFDETATAEKSPPRKRSNQTRGFTK
jgi:dienelactone hydrolase